MDCDASAKRRVGFVGVGTINAAIIRGLCRSVGAGSLPAGHGLVDFPLFVSPRNKSKASALAAEFGTGLVHVCKSNQDVVDATDVLVVGLTVPVTKQVMPELKIQANQSIINLVPGVTNKEMTELCGAPSVKAVPLPPVANHAGTTTVCPHDDFTEALFNRLGSCVVINDEEKLKVMYAATAMMGPFYLQVLTTARWLRAHGIPDHESGQFAAGFFRCASEDLVSKCGVDEVKDLWEEQTPGGLNEEAGLRMIMEGCYQGQGKALDAIYQRMLGYPIELADAKKEQLRRTFDDDDALESQVLKKPKV